MFIIRNCLYDLLWPQLSSWSTQSLCPTSVLYVNIMKPTHTLLYALMLTVGKHLIQPARRMLVHWFEVYYCFFFCAVTEAFAPHLRLFFTVNSSSVVVCSTTHIVWQCPINTMLKSPLERKDTTYSKHRNDIYSMQVGHKRTAVGLTWYFLESHFRTVLKCWIWALLILQPFFLSMSFEKTPVVVSSSVVLVKVAVAEPFWVIFSQNTNSRVPAWLWNIWLHSNRQNRQNVAWTAKVVFPQYSV